VPESDRTTVLHQFIARYIGSVEQLEILSLVSSAPGKTWSVAEVFRVIQSSEASVAECLKRFAEHGFLTVESGGGHRFAPNTTDLAECVAELTKAYRERRVSIIEMIYRRPEDPIKNFAEAFRFRKEN
jgi:sugar phosphate isomerase/epimerase